MSGMLLRVDGGPWREPAGSGYSSEAALQEILAGHPALIPGLSSDAVVCREFQSGVGPADLVAVDAEGSLTLVECKLAANPQVRREVIGQVLDYASRLWQMPVAEFDAKWTARTKESPFTTLGDEHETIRAAVEANLRDSRFRIVLAVDAINDDLRRIVEYLNAVTLPTTGIVAVEYLRVVDGAVEILTPRTYGEELADLKQAQDPGTRRKWSIDDYRAWAAERDPSAVDTVDALLEALATHGFEIHGGRASSPSLNASTPVAGVGRKWPICLYSYEKTGSTMEIRFLDFKQSPAMADRYLVAAAVEGRIPVDVEAVRAASYRKAPNVALREMRPDDAKAFVERVAAAFSVAPT